VTIPLVDLKAQYAEIRDEVNAAIQSVLDEATFVLGPRLESFETEFASFCGAGHCVGVANGTDALHLIFRGLGIGPGDEVIVPAFTFVATALGVSQAGAIPVLADVRREDGNIDPEQIRRLVTRRTKAIVAVHLYGRCADMDRLNAVAAAFGLKVIEDAAQAHGAAFKGRPAGSLGVAAAFSFYPSKNLGAYGDGGAITTNDSDLAQRLRLLRNWGSRKKHHHEEPGLNSRLDPIQAAVLSVKLRHLSEWNVVRRRHAALYDQLLADRVDLIRPLGQAHDTPAYHIYAIRARDRAQFQRRLHANDVETAIHYPFAIHQLRAYQTLSGSRTRLFESECWAAETLSLPMFAELTEQQIRWVVQCLD
jgi:dTDP-4-amino-4,6-dideoxygalactose transaminase